MSRRRLVGHVGRRRARHVAPPAGAALAQLRLRASLHVVAAQRQEGHKGGHELLMDDGRVVEATWGGEKRQLDWNGHEKKKTTKKCFLLIVSS